MKVEIQGDAVVGTVDIEAPPQTVFEALVDPRQLEAWWGDQDTYRTANWQIDARPGGSWSCEALNKHHPGPMKVRGVYKEFDPPRTLAYTWNPGWDTALPETLVRFTLEPIASGTRVHLVHSGFAGMRPAAEQHHKGWSLVLGWLARHAARQAAGSKS